MEEKPNPPRTPRKNPTPRKLVRINLEPPHLQSTSLNVTDSDNSCQLIHGGASTCITATSECNRATKRQLTKRASVKTKSFLDKDVSSTSAMPKASKRCKESESRKRKESDKLLEPLSKRKKWETADVGYSNESVESRRSKSSKPVSKSQACKKSQIHKDLNIQSQPQPKPQSAEGSEGHKNCSAQVAVTGKSRSQNTKQIDDLIGQNTETVSSLNLSSVCKRLFDVANEYQAKDRPVANSVLPEVLTNTVSESNSDSTVMDLSLKSPNFSLSDLAFSLSSTSLTDTPKTELALEYLSESYGVLDLSTVETDKFSDSVSNQSFLHQNASGFSVSKSAVRIFVKCEDGQMIEGFNSSVIENLPDENTKAKSTPYLPNSSVYTTIEEKEELADSRSTPLLSPSDCADLKQDKRQPTDTEPQSESQVNVLDIHTTPPATDGIQQLADELGVLNQQSSYVATHMYRRQTPRRKRSFGIRQMSTGMLSENSSSSGTPFRRFSRRTPSKSSPRVTPRRPDRTVVSPLVSKLIFASPAARGAVCSPLKMRTPLKPTAKRKLYSDCPKVQTETQEPLASTSKSENCAEKSPTTLLLDVELNSNETVRNVTDMPPSPIDVPSTPDQLRIVEDENDDDVPVFDFEIDNILEEKSKKFVHLTAKNVRSIIHQVLTNEDVKHIMRTALQEGSLKEQFQAAIFEPMLTRSKLKEVIEKGQILPPFGRNPPRASSSKTFLDMNFPEEEDDEEYQPSKEELEHVSDEESVHSSQANDYGSPSFSSVPMRSRMPSSASDSDSTTCGTPMGPPPAPPLRSQLTTDMIDKESNIALRTRSKLPLHDTPLVDIEASLVEPDSIPDLYNTECDEEDWAQFLLDLNRDFPSNDNLDDDLNDPEFDFLNEEENVEDDPEESRNDRAVQIPKKEVKELVSEILEEHEEYESLSELLEDLDEFPPASVEGSDALVSEASSPCTQSTSTVVDNNEVRVQQAIVTPVTEVNSGSNYVQFEARSEAGNLNSTDWSGYPGLVPPLRMNPPLVSAFMHELIKLRNTDNEESDVRKSTKTAKSGNEWNFTHNEQNQLKDQMRKHVQLLAQSYVQSWPHFNDSELVSLADSSKQTLVQLKELAQCSVVPYKQSYFYTPNLEEAINVTSRSYERKHEDIAKILQNLMTEKVMCQKMYQIRGLGYEQMEVFLTSRAFIFPQMLPEYRMESLEEGEKKYRVLFSESEDNLLAMGLDQFGHLPNKYSLIRQYLLPTKTNDQLKCRFKNCRSKKLAMNPVKFLAMNKRLPVFRQYLDVEDEGSIVAPKDRDVDLLPKWFVAFKDAVQLYRKHQNLKPWTFCGVPGSFLLEHGNQFDNLASLSKRTKECDILPQRQTQSVMQIVVTNPSASLVALGSQPMTIGDSSAIYLTNPSVTYSEQPIIMANPNANFTNQSVTFAVPSMTVSDSLVTSSFTCNNAGSGSTYQVVGTLYPISSSEAMPNPATQMMNQEWAGMQVVNLEPQMTSSSVQMANPATLTATQMAKPAQPVAHLDPQITSSSMLAANWAPNLVNQAVQVDDPNTQAEYAIGANSVDPFTLSTVSGLPAALTVNTQGFVGGWNTQAPVPVTAGPSSDGFTPNPGSTCSQPYSHVVLEQSLSDSSFSLFSGLTEVFSDSLPCPSSLTEPPATPSGVPVTTETYPRSVNTVNLSPSFSSGCVDNPHLLNSEIPVSNSVLNYEIPGSGAVTSADAKIKDSWNEKIVSSAATTAVVLSTPQGSNTRSRNSVVLSPTKVISKLHDIPEPLLILTKEQLTMLGISVDVLSLPTVSTPKIMNQSPSNSRPVQEVQQEPAIEEEVVRDPVQSPESSKLRSPEVEDDNSLLHVNTKDILNYAFAKAMGMSMSELQKSQECDESLVSAETSVLETAEGQPRSDVSFTEDIQETQSRQVTEQPVANPLERYFQRNATYDEINKYSMLSENSMETEENQTDPATFSVHPMQMSSGCSVESSRGEVGENPNTVRQSGTVTSSETDKDQVENPMIDQSSFGFGGFGDMLRNNCSLSPRRGILAEPDENATLCTPKKYVVMSPRAETSCEGTDFGTQSPDQSGFNSPTASAALHSSTPRRSPLCHQWRSPPVRSSTTSLRSKRKPLGHVSPIKFPLGNPSPFTSSSASNTSLFAVKPSTKKRDRLGQRSLQPIAPRTFGVSTSPMKSTIGSLRVKNKRKKAEISSVMRRILPKPGATVTGQLPNSEIYSTPPSGKRPKRLEKNAAGDEKSEAESSRSTGVGSEQMESEGDEAPTTAGGCDMDSQTEEENEEELHLAELLEASTTIRVPPRGSRSHAGQHKAEQKKEMALAMLAPDLVANDRLRDERDAMFARVYHCKVRKTLENDVALYKKFLQQFVEFDQKSKTVEELYGEIKSLLSGYPELVSDFAGFLSPEQAVECQCLMTNYKFTRARIFMCKLELYFQKHPSQLQKCVKAFKEWLDGAYSNDDLYNAVLPLIRSNLHLVDEFSVFFEDKKPPQSHLSKYEEVTLGESDDETQDCDDYEKVDLSLQENSYGTPNCPCRCHVNGAELFVKKLRHCTSCGLKVIKGELYLQTSDKLLRPATVTFHRQNTNKDEIPDQSTGRKLVTKFKTSKATSLKQKKSTSKKVSVIKDRSPVNGTMVMEPDSTSMMSPLNSDLGAENCTVAVEMDDTDKSDDFMPEKDLVSSCHEMQMGSTSQEGITAQITVSSSSNSRDVGQPTVDGSQFQRTDFMQEANRETDAETTLSNGGTDASAIYKSSTDCGDGKDVPPVDDGSSGTGVRFVTETDCEFREQVFDKNCDTLTGVKQDCGSLALDVSFEESNIDSHADQGSCSSEEVRSVSHVESLADVEANADPDEVHRDSVHRQFNITTEVNDSLDSSDKDDCQNESRAAGVESSTAGGSTAVNQSSTGWTSDEDGLILTTCQQLDPETNAYQIIVQTLTHRTVEEVSERFDFLMNMIAELNELSDGSATEDDDSDMEDL